MFHKHQCFSPPSNETQKCWRYLDFTKFADLIDSSQLYFTRVDKLEDVFEGTFTRKTYDEKNKAGLDNPKFYQSLRENCLVSCWHMNDYESAAMWKLYLKSDEGIAIQSTYNRLVESFDVEKRFHNFIGTVNYLDYEKDAFDFSNTFNAFLNKRKSFEHEKEIRVIVDLTMRNPDYKSNELQVDHGLKINIDLSVLIENIYITPTAPSWILDLLKSFTNKYRFNFTIKQSELTGSVLI